MADAAHQFRVEARRLGIQLQLLANVDGSLYPTWARILHVARVDRAGFATWHSQVETLFATMRRATPGPPGQQIGLVFDSDRVIYQAYQVACQADEVDVVEKGRGSLRLNLFDSAPVCRTRKLRVVSFRRPSSIEALVMVLLPRLTALAVQSDVGVSEDILTSRIQASALAHLVDLSVINVSVQRLSTWLEEWAACHDRPLNKLSVSNLNTQGLLVIPSAAVGPHTWVSSDVNTQISPTDGGLAYFGGDGAHQTPEACATMRPRIMTLRSSGSLRKAFCFSATVISGAVGCDLVVQASSSRALVVGVTIEDDSYMGHASVIVGTLTLGNGDGDPGERSVQTVQQQLTVRFPTAILTLCRLEEAVERHCVVHAERLRAASVATVHRMVHDLGLFESRAYTFDCPISVAGVGTPFDLPAQNVIGSAARSYAALAVAARAWREDLGDTLLHGVYRYLALTECLDLLRASAGTYQVHEDDALEAAD